MMIKILESSWGKQGCKNKPVMLTWAVLMPQNTENLKKYSNQDSEWDSVLCLVGVLLHAKRNEKNLSENFLFACL